MGRRPPKRITMSEATQEGAQLAGKAASNLTSTLDEIKTASPEATEAFLFGGPIVPRGCPTGGDEEVDYEALLREMEAKRSAALEAKRAKQREREEARAKKLAAKEEKRREREAAKSARIAKSPRSSSPSKWKCLPGSQVV